MAVKKRKGVRAGNSNPGGSKTYPNLMDKAMANTNPFGIGMRSGDSNISRPGDGWMMNKGNPANKNARRSKAKKK